MLGKDAYTPPPKIRLAPISIRSGTIKIWKVIYRRDGTDTQKWMTPISPITFSPPVYTQTWYSIF